MASQFCFFIEFRGAAPVRSPAGTFLRVHIDKHYGVREKLGTNAVYCTREPGDSAPGILCQQFSQKKLALAPETVALLYAADRVEHIAKDLLPRLEAGQTVLCDRYYFSNFAYQTLTSDLEDLLRYNAFQSLQLGGLAAAVQSLKYNEFALFHTPTSFCFSPQYSKISPPGQDQGGNWGDNLKIPLQYRAKIGMI